jgi:hypothetical protein
MIVNGVGGATLQTSNTHLPVETGTSESRVWCISINETSETSNVGYLVKKVSQLRSLLKVRLGCTCPVAFVPPSPVAPYDPILIFL